MVLPFTLLALSVSTWVIREPIWHCCDDLGAAVLLFRACNSIRLCIKFSGSFFISSMLLVLSSPTPLYSRFHSYLRMLSHQRLWNTYI